MTKHVQVDLCSQCSRPRSDHHFRCYVCDPGTQRPSLFGGHTETASELQETGARIAGIRDADMKDMNDYVNSFSEMAPLLDNYDRELGSISDLYNDSRVRDKSRLSAYEALRAATKGR